MNSFPYLKGKHEKSADCEWKLGKYIFKLDDWLYLGMGRHVPTSADSDPISIC